MTKRVLNRCHHGTIPIIQKGRTSAALSGRRPIATAEEVPTRLRPGAALPPARREPTPQWVSGWNHESTVASIVEEPGHDPLVDQANTGDPRDIGGHRERDRVVVPLHETIHAGRRDADLEGHLVRRAAVPGDRVAELVAYRIAEAAAASGRPVRPRPPGPALHALAPSATGRENLPPANLRPHRSACRRCHTQALLELHRASRADCPAATRVACYVCSGATRVASTAGTGRCHGLGISARDPGVEIAAEDQHDMPFPGLDGLMPRPLTFAHQASEVNAIEAREPRRRGRGQDVIGGCSRSALRHTGKCTAQRPRSSAPPTRGTFIPGGYRTPRSSSR